MYRLSTICPTTRTLEIVKRRVRAKPALFAWLVLSVLPLYHQFCLLPRRSLAAAVVESPQYITVGVAVTVTGCSTFPLDGAAILKYSLSNLTSFRYRYQFYAIYHPTASACVGPLASIGYTLLERDSPVNVSTIQGDFLRKHISSSGCCGEKELIKFDAFQLTQHPVVVLCDADMIFLKSLDAILDLMLVHQQPDAHHLMYPEQELPRDIWLLYTTDYYNVYPKTAVKPTQGGFAVIRPNKTIYEDIRAIVQKGDFHPDGGWGKVTMRFWGSTTFQGLMPYYFQILHPGHAVELNWCIHNNMNAPPRIAVEIEDNVTAEVCFTNQADCEDCRSKNLSEVTSVHMTLCQKPWTCIGDIYGPPQPETQLCREMHRTWFLLRSELERSWGRTGRGNGTVDSGEDVAVSLGFCHDFGSKGYEPIQEPFGRV